MWTVRKVGFGRSGGAWFGLERRVVVRSGREWFGRNGSQRRVLAGCGGDRFGAAGKAREARFVEARHGEVRYGMAG